MDCMDRPTRGAVTWSLLSPYHFTQNINVILYSYGKLLDFLRFIWRKAIYKLDALSVRSYQHSSIRLRPYIIRHNNCIAYISVHIHTYVHICLYEYCNVYHAHICMHECMAKVWLYHPPLNMTINSTFSWRIQNRKLDISYTSGGKYK